MFHFYLHWFSTMNYLCWKSEKRRHREKKRWKRQDIIFVFGPVHAGSWNFFCVFTISRLGDSVLKSKQMKHRISIRNVIRNSFPLRRIIERKEQPRRKALLCQLKYNTEFGSKLSKLFPWQSCWKNSITISRSRFPF